MFAFMVGNLATKVRRTVWQGRKYLVAPVSMLVPGVLKGSEGELYYPEEQVKANPNKWNGMPIVLNHPTDPGGKFITARDPSVLEKVQLGAVYKATFKKKLRAEGWFDEEWTKSRSPETYDRLVKGTAIEVSTGLNLDAKKARPDAVHNDRPYQWETSNYRPDHLAVLTDKAGACSVKDGCGVFNADGNQEPEPDCENNLTVNELSFDEIRQEISEQLCARYTQDMPHCYVVAIYDDYCVFEQGMETYRLEYSKTDSGVTLSSDEPKKVERVVTWVDTDTSSPQESETGVYSNQSTEGNVMKLSSEDRKATVEFIVANCDCWKGDEAGKVLATMPDGQLTKVKEGVTKVNETVANAARAQADAKLVRDKMPKEYTAPDGTKFILNETTLAYEPARKPEPVVNQEAKLSPEQERLLARARKTEDKEREVIIGKLVANKRGDERKKAEAFLGKKTLDELEELAMFAPAETATDKDQDDRPRRRYLPPNGRPVANAVPDEDDDDEGDGPLPSTYDHDWSEFSSWSNGRKR